MSRSSRKKPLSRPRAVPFERFVAVIAPFLILQVVFDGALKRGIGAPPGQEPLLLFLPLRLGWCSLLLLGRTPGLCLSVEVGPLSGGAGTGHLGRWFAGSLRCHGCVSPWCRSETTMR